MLRVGCVKLFKSVIQYCRACGAADITHSSQSVLIGNHFIYIYLLLFVCLFCLNLMWPLWNCPRVSTSSSPSHYLRAAGYYTACVSVVPPTGNLGAGLREIAKDVKHPGFSNRRKLPPQGLRKQRENVLCSWNQ